MFWSFFHKNFLIFRGVRTSKHLSRSCLTLITVFDSRTDTILNHIIRSVLQYNYLRGDEKKYFMHFLNFIILFTFFFFWSVGIIEKKTLNHVPPNLDALCIFSGSNFFIIQETSELQYFSRITRRHNVRCGNVSELSRNLENDHYRCLFEWSIISNISWNEKKILGECILFLPRWFLPSDLLANKSYVIYYLQCLMISRDGGMYKNLRDWTAIFAKPTNK